MRRMTKTALTYRTNWPGGNSVWRLWPKQKAKIAERVKPRDEQAQQDYQDKLERQKSQRQAGKKPRGPGPKAPDTGAKADDQINLTDEESRIMPSHDGFVQGYNGQADALLADTGYFSAANVRACAMHNIKPLIAMGRDSHHQPLAERLAPDAPEPDTDDPVVNMAWYLKTREGKACYAKRKCTVEPVFGIIKQVLGFRQFSLRGLDAVAGEWKLVAMAFNLKRMHALVRP